MWCRGRRRRWCSAPDMSLDGRLRPGRLVCVSTLLALLFVAFSLNRIAQSPEYAGGAAPTGQAAPLQDRSDDENDLHHHAEELAAPPPCLRRDDQGSPDQPMIYAITPTYPRNVQKADLTRLSQTLMHLDNFHWIIVEDSDKKTPLVESFLRESGLRYTHLVARTKKHKQIKPTEPHWMKARGVEQRNAGLEWVRKNLNTVEQLNGVLFFMDDDNTYALKIFDEMRRVKKVGVWPVGLVGGMMVERPLVDSTGKHITGFNSVWRPERPFPIDMAGFAIHLSLIKNNPDAVFTHKVQAGYQESEILRQLITRDELEPLADKCTKVYVWHTRTEKPKMNEENKLRAKNPKGSNDGIEV